MTHSVPPTAWLRPTLTLFGQASSTFRICGLTGLLLGTTLALFLADRAGSSPVVVAAMLGMGSATFLILVMATKILTGSEALVYYHHEVAILMACGALLRLLGQPVLPSLDVTALGIGVFLVFGRCGCLMVGCCHGKPYRWGVRYGHAHAAQGFPSCYVGVRLFPVQMVEALLVASIVLLGSLSVLQNRPPGSALSWYVVSYSAARIWIEELRGDRARPYWLGLSEAQWTSLLLILGIVSSEWQGRLPWSAWHLVLLGIAAASLIVLASCRTAGLTILLPRHASEIAEIVKSTPPSVGPVAVHRTSLSVGVSSQSLGPLAGGDATLFSLSRADRPLTFGEADALARLISHVCSRYGDGQELVAGRHDVFHLISREPVR
jgi:F0F1-type ATP synthase assembly protein I